MPIQTLIKMSQHRKRHRRHQHLIGACYSLLLSCLLQQLYPIRALYLQQVPDQLANNGALMQAISQLSAQQGAGGLPLANSQVVLSMDPNGPISLQGTGNNQNNGLVNMNNNNNNNMINQTAPSVMQSMLANTNSHKPGNYVLKVYHSDPTKGISFIHLEPVNYTNLHEPRIELRYQSKYPYVSMPEGSPTNTVVAAVVVQDEDSGPSGETTLTIEHGNELGHFKLVSTAFTNTIQVNGSLSRHGVREYNLTIVARDHGSPPKSSSSNLVIKVQPGPNMAPIQPSPDVLANGNKPPVTDLMYVGTMLVLMFAAVVILIIFGCALVQRPQKANKHSHKGLPPTRTTSATNSRIISPTDQCSAYCLSNGYNLTNL